MCEFASSIVMRHDYRVIWFPGIDSHSDILALAHIDDTRSHFVPRRWAKVELRPPDDDYYSIPIDRWTLIIDETTEPDWFDSNHAAAVRAAVAKRLEVERGSWICRRPDGSTTWHLGRKRHRDNDEPAIVWATGTKEWWRDGERHRDDGPAIERPDGDMEWWRNDKRHRDDGPAIERANGKREWWHNDKRHRDNDEPAVIWSTGKQEWWRDGRRHRDDGPAIVWATGMREWWRDGERHRDDGPAIERPDGDMEWWRNGKRHRDDGPAIERSTGDMEWWRDGKRHRTATRNGGSTA